MDQSPFLLIKSLETQLNSMLSGLDLYELPNAERKLVTSIKQELIDTRLDVRDYELSETRADQIRKAADAQTRLERLRQYILTASEYNVFGAVDVAQLTAQLEQIIVNVR